MPSLRNATTIQTLFEGGRVIPQTQRPAPTVFTDAFEPFGVHVYKLN